MSRFDQYQQRLLGLVFIVGPLLLITAALTFLLGIGLSSHGVSSWVEGVLMTLAFLLFVPIYLHLARVLGQRAPGWADLHHHRPGYRRTGLANGRIPHAHIVTISGGTHLIVATHGPEIGRAVAQFINKTSANHVQPT